jgi:putative transposase
MPDRRQHRALEAILESQRQLYNAALQERIDAYRKAGITRAYFDQTKALTEWRQSDPEASALPVNLQRATPKRLDEAYRAFFRRLDSEGKVGFPRFRGRGWFDSFGFRQFVGITLRGTRLRFKGMPVRAPQDLAEQTETLSIVTSPEKER